MPGAVTAVPSTGTTAYSKQPSMLLLVACAALLAMTFAVPIAARNVDKWRRRSSPVTISPHHGVEHYSVKRLKELALPRCGERIPQLERLAEAAKSDGLPSIVPDVLRSSLAMRRGSTESGDHTVSDYSTDACFVSKGDLNVISQALGGDGVPVDDKHACRAANDALSGVGVSVRGLTPEEQDGYGVNYSAQHNVQPMGRMCVVSNVPSATEGLLGHIAESAASGAGGAAAADGGPEEVVLAPEVRTLAPLPREPECIYHVDIRGGTRKRMGVVTATATVGRNLSLSYIVAVHTGEHTQLGGTTLVNLSGGIRVYTRANKKGLRIKLSAPGADDAIVDIPSTHTVSTAVSQNGGQPVVVRHLLRPVGRRSRGRGGAASAIDEEEDVEVHTRVTTLSSGTSGPTHSAVVRIPGGFHGLVSRAQDAGYVRSFAKVFRGVVTSVGDVRLSAISDRERASEHFEMYTRDSSALHRLRDTYALMQGARPIRPPPNRVRAVGRLRVASLRRANAGLVRATDAVIPVAPPSRGGGGRGDGGDPVRLIVQTDDMKDATNGKDDGALDVIYDIFTGQLIMPFAGRYGANRKHGGISTYSAMMVYVDDNDDVHIGSGGDSGDTSTNVYRQRWWPQVMSEGDGAPRTVWCTTRPSDGATVYLGVAHHDKDAGVRKLVVTATKPTGFESIVYIGE